MQIFFCNTNIFLAMQIYVRWLLELHQHLQLLQRHQLVSNLTCRENLINFQSSKLLFKFSQFSQNEDVYFQSLQDPLHQLHPLHQAPLRGRLSSSLCLSIVLLLNSLPYKEEMIFISVLNKCEGHDKMTQTASLDFN